LKKFLSTAVLSLSLLILLIPAPNSYAGVDSISVFSEDFESGVLPSQFSGAGAIEDTQNYNDLADAAFGEDFLRNTTVPPQATVLQLTGLQCHTEIDILFYLAIIDSWDGSATSIAPDFFNVEVDGSSVFMKTFDAFDLSDQSAPTTSPPLIQWNQFNLFGGGDEDGAYNFSMDPDFQDIDHTSDTLTVEFFASGNGWQGGSDESWAIDNVEIILNGINDPNCVTPPPPDDGVVGGEFLPIETTSLLLAAASSPAAWLTSLTIVALGIGAYVFTRNSNNMRNIKVILRDYLDRL